MRLPVNPQLATPKSREQTTSVRDPKFVLRNDQERRHEQDYADGALRGPKVLVDLGLRSGLDGMCFDGEGRLLIARCGASSSSLPILTRLEQTIAFSDPAITNVCFGGDNSRTVFVTRAEAGQLAAIRWPVAGTRLFPDR